MSRKSLVESHRRSLTLIKKLLLKQSQLKPSQKLRLKKNQLLMLKPNHRKIRLKKRNQRLKLPKIRLELTTKKRHPNWILKCKKLRNWTQQKKRLRMIPWNVISKRSVTIETEDLHSLKRKRTERRHVLLAIVQLRSQRIWIPLLSELQITLGLYQKNKSQDQSMTMLQISKCQKV